MKLLVPYNRENFQINRYCSSKKLDILTARDLYKYIMILKYYYDSNYKIKAVHNMSTRFITNQMYVLPPHINNYGKKTRNFQIPIIFNSIPRNLMAFNTYSSIKSEIKNWIFQN